MYFKWLVWVCWWGRSAPRHIPGAFVTRQSCIVLYCIVLNCIVLHIVPMNQHLVFSRVCLFVHVCCCCIMYSYILFSSACFCVLVRCCCGFVSSATLSYCLSPDSLFDWFYVGQIIVVWRPSTSVCLRVCLPGFVAEWMARCCGT